MDENFTCKTFLKYVPIKYSSPLGAVLPVHQRQLPSQRQPSAVGDGRLSITRLQGTSDRLLETLICPTDTVWR